jgi:hypothetical protein
MSPETEKAPVAITTDASEATTPPATSSTAVLYCDVYGRIRTEPPMAPEDLIAAVQPADVLNVRPRRNLHWRDTLQTDGQMRWQSNNRRSSR